MKKAKETRNKYPKDITGLKFGRLTVLEKTNIKSNQPSDNGAYLWKCQCDCGNKTICYYSRYALITPNGVKSCGCLYNESRYKTGKKYCEYDLDTYDFGIGYCNNGTFFYFDKEDYDKIKDYSWWYDGRYVCAHSLENDKYTTKIIRLHRVVLDIEDREDINVDHKNLIRYDCRKCNLRKATDSENSWNKDYSYIRTESGVTGVRKNGNKWVAYISVKNKNINLGTFTKIEDAINSRKLAEEKYFGEFRFDMSNKDVINEDNLKNHLIYKKCG